MCSCALMVKAVCFRGEVNGGVNERRRTKGSWAHGRERAALTCDVPGGVRR